MDFKFSCPFCAQHIQVDSAGCGSSCVCPNCNKDITIPNPNVAVPIAPKVAITNWWKIGAISLAGFILILFLGVFLESLAQNQQGGTSSSDSGNGSTGGNPAPPARQSAPPTKPAEEIQVVDASAVVHVWNQMVSIDRTCKNDIQSGEDGVATGRLCLQRLRKLNSTSERVDPELVELINRKIDVIGEIFDLSNEATKIENSDPNNRNMATIPDRLNAKKSLEDIAAESNRIDDFQKDLRIELQDKYHIELNEE